MFLCRVTGTVTATRKDSRFEGSKLLIVHPIDVEGELLVEPDMLALDPRFDAGEGDVVLVAREGAVVRQLLGQPAPTNVVVVGVVDGWQIDDDTEESRTNARQ
jgi:microcompartment protein CcmK/EutM